MILQQAIGTSILVVFIGFIGSVANANEICDGCEKKTEIIEIEKKEKRKTRNVRPVISVRGGWDYAEVGKTDNVAITPNISATPNAYVPNDKWHTKGVWGGLLGLEIDINCRNIWQTGVAYYNTGKFEIDGLVKEQGQPLTENLKYQYNVKNQRVLWENKWLMALNKRLYFYLLGGIGAAFNKASDYSEVSLDPLAYPNAPFEDKSKTSFTWSAGLGFEIRLFERLRAGLGYQYSDLGQVELDNAVGQTTNEAISFNSTPTNEFLGSLTYIF